MTGRGQRPKSRAYFQEMLICHDKALTIASMDDINALLKESEFLKICQDAGIITSNVFNVMDMALKRRNAAAHPSTTVIDQLQTDAYISDLINNAVLKIK